MLKFSRAKNGQEISTIKYSILCYRAWYHTCLIHFKIINHCTDDFLTSNDSAAKSCACVYRKIHQNNYLQAFDKHLKNTKLYSIEFLRTKMTSDLSNWSREHEPSGEYSL